MNQQYKVRHLFLSYATIIIWEHKFEGLDFNTIDFGTFAQENLIEGITVLQDKFLQIFHGIRLLRDSFVDPPNDKEIIDFFAEKNRMEELETEQEAQTELYHYLQLHFIYTLYTE